MAIGGLAEESMNSAEGALDITSLIQPLIDSIGPLIIKLGVFVGGVGLLYLVLILIRVYYEREKVQLLKDIRYNQVQMNKHYGVKYTIKKKGLIKRFFYFFRRF